MLSHPFIFALLDAAIKTTLLMIVAIIIARASRRASASFRHLVWTLGLGCALGLPLLSYALPHWQVSAFTAPVPLAQGVPTEPKPLEPRLSELKPLEPKAVVNQGVSVANTASTHSEPSSATVPPRNLPHPAESVTNADPPKNAAALSSATPLPAPFPWAVCVFWIWIAGAAFMLVQSACGIAGLHELSKNTGLVTQGPLADAAWKAASSLEVKLKVELRQENSLGKASVPLTYGVWRPIVVLPTEAEKWPSERLHAALLHEMAHIKRHDWTLQMLGHLVAALYWFHPLIWIGLKQMRTESEAACDDMVLAAGVPAQDYARHLLDVALSVRNIRRLRSGTVAMAQGPKVEGRLRAVLALGISRRPITQRAITGVFVVCLLILAPLASLRLGAQVKDAYTQGVSVPEADRLQLHGDFTLRYAVTITDSETTEARFRQYQQLRADYQRELRKDPYMQPVPAEYYAPFSYFQSLRPRTRQMILTISSQNGQLLWRKEEDGHTFALVYNGRNGTQLFSDGHSGRVEPGLQFSEMSDCPLPALGLPYIPLLKSATLLSSSGSEQTWEAQSPLDSAVREQGKALYEASAAHVIYDAGVWKLLDVDSTDQRFQFLQHQRFQGLWLATHMTLTKFTTAPLGPGITHFSSQQELFAFLDSHRTPTSVCEYHLLSASSTPLNLSAVGMHAVSAAQLSTSIDQDQPLDDFAVQEALHLRYHLQDWAAGHKALLLQMARNQPQARTAVAQVYKSLNGLPLPLWQGDVRPAHVWDGDPRIGHDGQKPIFTGERLSVQDLAAVHDFEVARSRNAGMSHVVLWASGRITRNTALGSKGPETQQEIVPAFFDTDGTSNMAENGPKASLSASPAPSAPQLKSTPQLKPAVGFRRYTSPPLPDGTRYTFLYPSYYARVKQGWMDSDYQFGTVRIDCIGTPPVPWIAVARQTPVSYYVHGKQGAQWLAPHEEFCTVLVGRLGNVILGRSGNLVFPRGNNLLRQNTRWAGENGNHHGLSIFDKRSQLRFQFIHEDRYIPALFKQTDPIMANSFRILPPGTSVFNLPTPAAEAASIALALNRSAGDTSAAQVALGQQLQQKGQPHDGIAEFRRAVQIDPSNAEAQSQLAQALYQINWKHFKTALRDTTVSLAPPSTVLDEAILHMRRAAALRPSDARWHSTLATYLSNRGRHTEAVAEYRRSMHLLPPLPAADIKPSIDGSISANVEPWYDAYWTLGEELVQTGHYQEAVQNLRQALRFNPSSAPHLLWLGDALNGEGKRSEARAAWKKSLAARPPNSYYQRLARQRLARN